MSSKIDGLIHQPARLRIMSILFVTEEVDMKYLKQKTKLTWGNLSTHVSRLEEGELVEIQKEIVEKKTNTTVSLTDKGREAFRKYREQMMGLLEPVEEDL